MVVHINDSARGREVAREYYPAAAVFCNLLHEHLPPVVTTAMFDLNLVDLSALDFRLSSDHGKMMDPAHCLLIHKLGSAQKRMMRIYFSIASFEFESFGRSKVFRQAAR